MITNTSSQFLMGEGPIPVPLRIFSARDIRSNLLGDVIN